MKSDRLMTSWGHGTKSLRDTGTVRLVVKMVGSGEAPCLEDRGVPNSLKTGVAYDNQGDHPAASAYDRRHECAQALWGHAKRPHSQLQAVRGVSKAIP